MNIWEQAAQRLTGYPVEVRTPVLPYGLSGMAGWENGVRTIALSPGVRKYEQLENFLHEVAHHFLGHVSKTMTGLSHDELREAGAELAFNAKANVAYRAQKHEREARAQAEVWLKQIDDASWPHGALPESKLQAWLKTAPETTSKEVKHSEWVQTQIARTEKIQQLYAQGFAGKNVQAVPGTKMLDLSKLDI